MDHDRPVAAVVGAGVFDVETLRKLKVDLQRAELPAATDRILDVHVDLRTVEGSSAVIDRVGNSRAVDGVL